MDKSSSAILMKVKSTITLSLTTKDRLAQLKSLDFPRGVSYEEYLNWLIRRTHNISNIDEYINKRKNG